MFYFNFLCVIQLQTGGALQALLWMGGTTTNARERCVLLRPQAPVEFPVLG